MEAVDPASALFDQGEYLRIPPDVKDIENQPYFLGSKRGGQFERLADRNQHGALGRVHGVEWLQTEFNAVLAGAGGEGSGPIRQQLSGFAQAYFRPPNG